MKPARWEYHCLAKNEAFVKFWTERCKRERQILFIVGLGFDPRMCNGIKLLMNAGGPGKRDVIAIDFDEGPDSPSQALKALTQQNRAELERLIGSRGTVNVRRVKVVEAEGRRVESVSAARLLSSMSELSSYDDLILDISALPRSIYYTLVAKILHLRDEARLADATARLPNFHVMVTEDAELDGKIRQEGVEESAQFIHGFSGGAQQEASANTPCIWMPLLGEAQEVQFKVIQDFVTPNEVLPVLPSPARNSRRADSLVIEYRERLFDSLRLDPRNFIYADEQNPFEVYRQLSAVIARYRRSLNPLGGARFVLSALSSKLMSIGALLVAIELKTENVVGLAHVSSHGYQMDALQPGENALKGADVFGLWLAGEFYE